MIDQTALLGYAIANPAHKLKTPGDAMTMATLMWFEMPLIALIGSFLVARHVVPPQYYYLSRRKRRAMRLALDEFARTHDCKPDKARCRICSTDAERCIIMIPHVMTIRPPVLSSYSVSHDSKRADYLGSGQFHWGITPEDEFDIALGPTDIQNVGLSIAASQAKPM